MCAAKKSASSFKLTAQTAQNAQLLILSFFLARALMILVYVNVIVY